MSDTPAANGDPSKTGRSTARKRKPAARKSPKASADKVQPATAPAIEHEVASSPAPVALIRVPMSVRWRDLDAFNHVNEA